MSVENNTKNIHRLHASLVVLSSRVDDLVTQNQQKDAIIAGLLADLQQTKATVIVLDMKSRGSGPTG